MRRERSWSRDWKRRSFGRRVRLYLMVAADTLASADTAGGSSGATSPVRYHNPKLLMSLRRQKGSSQTATPPKKNSLRGGSELTEVSRMPTFSHRSPYSGVVNKVVLGLGDEPDVVKRRLGSRTWARLHAQPPLPHGSFL